MARHRPTVAEVRSLESKISQQQAQIDYERANQQRFGQEITCRILSAGSCYDYDEGKKLERLPHPKVGDIVIAEYWHTWMGGSDPTGLKIAVRVTTEPDEHDMFKATSLSSYVRLTERNEFYAFDSKSTRAIRA